MKFGKLITAGFIVASLVGVSVNIQATGSNAVEDVPAVSNAPVILEPVGGTSTNIPDVRFSGTASPNDTLTLIINDDPVDEFMAGADGRWSYLAHLLEGQNVAYVIDSQGRPSNSVTQRVDSAAPAQPEITSPASGVSFSTAFVQVSGTGEPETTAVLTVNGSEVGRGPVEVSGRWSVQAGPLKNGEHQIEVRLHDSVGNISQVASIKISVESAHSDSPSCVLPRPVAVFADTPTAHKFYTEIDWMECMKYSTGWRQPAGKPLYKPADNLERQAMAAFIYRMEAPKGYQAPKVSPFADVKPGDSFYTEIAWMHEMGYSTGWAEPSGKPTYRPHDQLSREAMAAFIYRLEAPKNYTAPSVSPMADMKPGMKFYQEISWMYDEGLSTGNKVGNTKEYWPKDKLSRQAMAAFIYRLVTDYRA